VVTHSYALSGALSGLLLALALGLWFGFTLNRRAQEQGRLATARRASA
jgi:hypothetical protein